MHAGLVYLAVVVCAATPASCLAAGKSANEEIVVKYNVPYHQGESKSWRLDLAMKKDLSGKPRPGIVVIHGGGWLEGDKSSFVFKDRSAPANIVDFAKLGFVAVTINYRMSREARFPAAIEDCKCAVRWLRTHAKEFNLDRDHIGAWGNSAGGHLALLLALAGRDSGLEGDGPSQDQSSQVQAAVSDSGPIDMIHQARDSVVSEVTKRFLGGLPEGKLSAAYKKASPCNYVQRDVPPLLLIYGGADLQIPVVTADKFVLALSQAGGAGRQLLSAGVRRPLPAFAGSHSRAAKSGRRFFPAHADAPGDGEASTPLEALMPQRYVIRAAETSASPVKPRQPPGFPRTFNRLWPTELYARS